MSNYKQQIVDSVLSNPNKKEILLDHTIVENCINTTLSDLQYSQPLDEEINDTKKSKLACIKEIIDSNLPPLERAILKRIYFDGLKQEGIAKLYNISQEMVSYYKTRAEKRVRYFLRAKNIGIKNMVEELKDIVTQKQLDALILYFRCHNQNMVAKQYCVTQSAISTRLKLGVKQIEQVIEDDDHKDLKKYCEVFKYLSLHNSSQTTSKKERF